MHSGISWAGILGYAGADTEGLVVGVVGRQGMRCGEGSQLKLKLEFFI